MLVYVDDIIIIGNNVQDVQTLICHLSQRFYLKDLGPLAYFLGAEVISHNNGIFLNQRKYIVDLLNITHMTNAKPASTPLAMNLITPLSDPSKYQIFVGRLQYLSIARPDLTYTVYKLA